MMMETKSWNTFKSKEIHQCLPILKGKIKSQEEYQKVYNELLIFGPKFPMSIFWEGEREMRNEEKEAERGQIQTEGWAVKTRGGGTFVGR